MENYKTAKGVSSIPFDTIVKMIVVLILVYVVIKWSGNIKAFFVAGLGGLLGVITGLG